MTRQEVLGRKEMAAESQQSAAWAITSHLCLGCAHTAHHLPWVVSLRSTQSFFLLWAGLSFALDFNGKKTRPTICTKAVCQYSTTSAWQKAGGDLSRTGHCSFAAYWKSCIGHCHSLEMAAMFSPQNPFFLYCYQ